MLTQSLKISEVLQSLAAKDSEELSLLQFILVCAQWIHRGGHLDWGARHEVLLDQQTPGLGTDIQRFLDLIPEDSKRYLHGLVEAMDIYQSIHGRTIRIENLTLGDKAMHDLRQIRDMCLQEGLRSIY